MLLALLCVVSEWLRNWDPTPKSLHRLGGKARQGRALRANTCAKATGMDQVGKARHEPN